MAMGPGPGYDPSNLGGGGDFDQAPPPQTPDYDQGSDQGGDQGGEQKQRDFNPSIAFYKPRKNFNPSDKATHGSAMKIDLQSKKEFACCFMNATAQFAATGQPKVFDWKNSINFKLSRQDMSKILTVFDFWATEVTLTHKNKSNTTIFKICPLGSVTEPWGPNLLAKGFSKFCFSTRLSRSVEGQSGFVAHNMLLQPEECIELREFLKWSMWKLFAIK